MSIATQKSSARPTALRPARAPKGDVPGPEAISPWEMLLCNEDKIPKGAIVIVPGKWVMQ
jgi:hypothetical protein